MITKTGGNAQFYSYMNRHSFCHTSYSFDYPFTKGLHYHPEISHVIITLRVPLQVNLLGRDSKGAWWRRDWSTMANLHARKYLIKKCPHIFTPVWERTIVSESEWLQLCERWNHVQLAHVKIGNS